MNLVDNESSLTVNAEIQVIQNVMVSRYFAAAGLVIALYDAILTIEDEVRLVWPGPFAASKLLYYINRYWTIASLLAGNYHIAGFRTPLSTASCRNWLFAGGAAAMIVEIASTAILILRVVALYDRARWVGRGLWILSGLLFTITVILASLSIKSFYNKFVYDPWAGVCLPSDLSFKTYAAVAIPVAFDIVILVLTALRTYRFAVASRKQSGSMILYIMFRDGILYFIVVVTLRIWNTIIWVALPRSFMYLGAYALWGMLSTMTSRIFLNLRSTAFDPPNDLQVQSAPALPVNSRRALPLESVRATVVNLDTTLFATVSGVEGNEYTSAEPVLFPSVPEATT